MRITPKQLAHVLFEITDKKSNEEILSSVADFARFLEKNRKLKLADKIIEQFSKIYNQMHGIVEAEITSRKKLDESELRKLKHFVKEKYKAKEVNLKNIVDGKIKGGITLKVGDEVVDGSVRGKLNELKKILST